MSGPESRLEQLLVWAEEELQYMNADYYGRQFVDPMWRLMTALDNVYCRNCGGDTSTGDIEVR